MDPQEHQAVVAQYQQLLANAVHETVLLRAQLAAVQRQVAADANADADAGAGI